MFSVAAYFNNLGAARTVREHLALQHIMKIHLVCVGEVGESDPAILADHWQIFFLKILVEVFLRCGSIE